MITYGPDFYELSKLLVNYINNYEICKCDKDIKSIDAKDISYELIYPLGMNNYFDSSCLPCIRICCWGYNENILLV